MKQLDFFVAEKPARLKLGVKYENPCAGKSSSGSWEHDYAELMPGLRKNDIVTLIGEYLSGINQLKHRNVDNVRWCYDKITHFVIESYGPEET